VQGLVGSGAHIQQMVLMCWRLCWCGMGNETAAECRSMLLCVAAVQHILPGRLFAGLLSADYNRMVIALGGWHLGSYS